MKKKGSTLITVVAIFAILFTTGTAIISLTLSSYKLRIAQSKKIENLYGSESGIDASKKILEVAVNTAIKKANIDVTAKNNEINGELEKLKVAGEDYKSIIDAAISGKQTSVINYILFLKNEEGNNNEENTLYYIDNDGNLNLEALKEKQKQVFSKSYKNVLNQYLKECIKSNNGISYQYRYIKLNSLNQVETIPVDFTMYSKIDLTYDDLTTSEISDISKNTIPITLLSKFTSDDGIEREIEAKFTLEVPDINNMTIANNPLIEKTIAIDGNMYVNNNLNINGDVFVKGEREENSSDVVYSKYDGGININISKNEKITGIEESNKDNITVNFNGNVVTPSTLNIKQKSNVTIDRGNLYANNVNLGKIKSNDSLASSNILIVKNDMVVDNDFTYNSNLTDVTIKNLYAINELRIPGTNDTPEKSSSSIIINNSMENGSITIEKDAFIIGSAYINVGKGYQTGESIAIKGNYSAYTYPLNDENNYEFNYYEPLQLVEKKNANNMLMDDKKDYFLAASSLNRLPNSGNIKLEGSEADNIYISGAYISYGDLKSPSQMSSSKEQKLENRRKEYANQVYFMGNSATGNSLLSSYNNMIMKPVSSYINLNEYGEKDIKENSDDYVVAIYNQNSTNIKPILLSDYNGSNSSYADVVNINNKKGIIITNGDVEFDNKKINFTGTIISMKDMITMGGRIDINYDGNVVRDLIKQYELEDIFYSINADIIGTEINNGINIDSKESIKNNYWKIVK